MSRTEGTRADGVLSTRTILWWAGGLGLLAITSLTVLWFVLRGSVQQAAVQVNIIRTAFSIVVGGGGAAGLLLTARRQRATELDLVQRDHDATETRVTELYGKAADQLGSDQAPVRLAGVFALERLGQNHAEHRQTIVDLLCAYLRMPFDQTGADPVQEQEVRETAQGVLTSHLRDEDDEALFWTGIRLNLAGATLSTFTFTRCRVQTATFAGARFVGPAVFRGCTFERQGDFRSVRFTGLADFRRVSFDGEGANFRGATFEAEVDFGTHTSAALTGATTRAVHNGTRRKWPADWAEEPDPERPDWARLVHSG
ncbi:pentapeptide repeat-containing protein [Saccharopolyspora sp. SCSIO 74807]|uniref:pentapeptide repeat-containing protein n=1 Tax=Saccharopolyspora sp. SCSIO 74807 TaxID=3118084 RepID=UPI0030CCE13C